MLKDIIAKRYAKALLSLADQAGKTEPVKNDLSSVAELYRTSKSLQSVFLSPAFSAPDKAKVLKGLSSELKVSDLSARFLDLLLAKRRFNCIREVAAAYSELLDAKQGRVKATVTAATALSDSEVTRLKDKIKAVVGKEVELKVEVDAGLIGGVRTRIGSTVFDGSLKNQMQKMKAALLK